MENSTQFTSFILAGYSDSGHLKYLYFILVTVLYVSIVFANTVLIVVICMERSLHEPMYLFLCSLFVNELYGSTALFPALMTNLVTDVHAVSTVYCYLQIFCMYTYISIEFSNLAVMSYDRYLAICYPLQYNVIMTPNRVCILVCVIWLYPFVTITTALSLTIRLQLCGNVIDKVYCDNYLVVKLACSTSDTTVNNIYGLCVIVLSVVVTLFTIMSSYIKILTICLKYSINARQKAFSTCIPHLASMLNFTFGCFLTLLQSRFDRPMRNVPTVLHTILSVYFLMCQPLFNPIMYGVRMAKIRQAFKNILPVGLYPKRLTKH
ncbi:olfactory receptor 11A1-like [Coregonus clupeaformis]|uniref:olfactory receptor 11A1-like n=1 Tax=Coregonus clupeaformis TaxID=59861 RepID=UPI001BE08768|nr:olfactory receptor 11A1-like [Coregonus clupeaformis]